MERDIRFWLKTLNLAEHPEGGFYREMYRSPASLSGRDGERSLFTSIYYLLGGDDRSRLHRIRSDEIWNFHSGDPLRICIIHADGAMEERVLGADPERAQSFQTVVPSGAWFGAIPAEGARYTLVSCIVVPGFDFRDFEMARRGELTARYPKHRATIELLTDAD